MNWHNARFRWRVSDGFRGLASSPFPRIFYSALRREASVISPRFEAELAQDLARFLMPGLSVSFFVRLVRAFFIFQPKCKSILTFFIDDQSTNLKYGPCLVLRYFNLRPGTVFPKTRMPKHSTLRTIQLTEKFTFCLQKGQKDSSGGKSLCFRRIISSLTELSVQGNQR